MGGHGHGHEAPYKIPDHKSFQVKGLWQLEELEKALKIKGLKDPWIRNEAWRYNPGFGTRLSRGMKVFFRGAPLGLALTLAHLAANKAFSKGDDHGHH